MSMEATRSISTFLRHVRERDLPDPELFDLKARTFDLMADHYDEDGQDEDAAECRRIAVESRAAAVSGDPMTSLGQPLGPESLPTDGRARTVEVSDRTGRTDPDVP